MLTKNPQPSDGWRIATKPDAIDIFPPVTQLMPRPANALVPREQFARVPVPEGFDTANLSTINKGAPPKL